MFFFDYGNWGIEKKKISLLSKRDLRRNLKKERITRIQGL